MLVRSNVWRKPAAGVIVAALVAASVVLLSAPSYAVTKRVSGAGVTWTPSFRRITVGDRIVWRAASGSHTVTAYRKRSGKRGRRWRKDVTLSAGQSTARRFTRPGLYRFKCTFHASQGMIGAIRVVRG
jgi:plastocyanin